MIIFLNLKFIIYLNLPCHDIIIDESNNKVVLEINELN